MDMKKLLESIDSMQRAEQHPTGPKFTGYWKGTDKRTPGKHMVGGDEQQESAVPDLKQLKKIAQESETEWKLKEMWANFNEEDLGTHPKRPARKSDRHPRGHEPQARYTTVKADESVMGDKDIELQDYRSMSHKEFQTAYGMTKTEWINKNKALVIQNPSIKKALGIDEAGNPAQQAAIAIAMKKAGKKPKNEQEELNQPRRPEVIDDLPKTPQDPNKGTVVKDYNRLPKDPTAPQKYPTVTDEGVAYKTANPHPASRDPIVAKVVKQMRPGLTGLEMGNEAFLYFAYELGKMRARDAWSDYLPAIKHFYQSGIGVNESVDLKKQADKYTELAVKANKAGDDEKCRAFQKKVADIKKKMAKLEEGWESGPEEYEEPYDDADDAYDRQRQEKVDTEAEKEWAKLPKVSTYQCTGRGANMEPNQKFGPEFDTLEKALEYRAEIMKDPKTPHPEHIGINTLTRVVDKEQTDESVDTFNRAGYNSLRDKNDYDEKVNDLIELGKKSGMNKQMQDQIQQRILDLRTAAIAKGFIQAESRGHNIVKKFLKDRGAWDNNPFAKDTTPSKESKNWVIYDKSSKKPYMAFDSKDQAHDFLFDKLGFDKDYTVLHKSELPLEEYATTTPGTAGAQGNVAISMTPVSNNDPAAVKQAQQTAQATQAIKSATGASAPSQAIVKSLNQLTQGKPLGSMDAKNLDPIADVAAAAMSGKNPTLTNQFKTLANQVRQLQQQPK